MQRGQEKQKKNGGWYPIIAEAEHAEHSVNLELSCIKSSPPENISFPRKRKSIYRSRLPREKVKRATQAPPTPYTGARASISILTRANPRGDGIFFTFTCLALNYKRRLRPLHRITSVWKHSFANIFLLLFLVLFFFSFVSFRIPYFRSRYDMPDTLMFVYILLFIFILFFSLLEPNVVICYSPKSKWKIIHSVSRSERKIKQIFFLRFVFVYSFSGFKWVAASEYGWICLYIKWNWMFSYLDTTAITKMCNGGYGMARQSIWCGLTACLLNICVYKLV